MHSPTERQQDRDPATGDGGEHDLRNATLAAAFALLAVVALGATACSNAGRSTGPTPVQTWVITPALGAPTKPAATATGVPSATPTGAATSALTSAATLAATAAATTASEGGGTKIVLVASNLTFDKTTLTVPAGQVTIEVDNKDSGIPHNIHFFKGADATGQSVGMTQITVGPATVTVTLTIEKCDYHFQCDVHPTTMTGKLTVS